MSRPRIKLYVDTVSPFAYLAYYILRVRVESSVSSLPRDDEKEKQSGMSKRSESTLTFVGVGITSIIPPLLGATSRMCPSSWAG